MIHYGTKAQLLVKYINIHHYIYINRDRAKSQVRPEGDWQASILDLANQRAIRAGVRDAASNHKEADRHACRCTVLLQEK
jgi:hypothetical protein